MVVRFFVALAALSSGVLATGCDDDDDDFVVIGGDDEGPGTTTALAFEVTPLVTSSTDPDLINPWGIATSEGLFWIADEGTGAVSVFDASGIPSEEYPSGRFNLGQGITGVVALEPAGDEVGGPFLLDTDIACATDPILPATFVFASMNGTLIAINDVAPAAGVAVVDRSAEGASYFGVAEVSMPDGPVLLAADFANGRIDMFDDRFQLVAPPAGAPGPFTDPELPTGFAPWNVVQLGDRVYVAYAQQSADEPGEEETGPGLGHVTVFDTSGAVIGRLANDLLNAPWGIAVAETDIGEACDPGAETCTAIAQGTLLVGNFGDGTITTFDPERFEATGQLRGTDGNPLVVEGLWGLTSGAGAATDSQSLFFAAGPAEETAGVFGRLDPVPVTVTVTTASIE